MANFGPIQVPSNLSNLKTLPDIVRFLSAFSAQIASAFNGLIATKGVWGVIGASGNVLSGSDNFGASLVSTGNYHIAYREPYRLLPATVATAHNDVNSQPTARIAGSTLGSIDIQCTNGSNAVVNNRFSFIVQGAR